MTIPLIAMISLHLQRPYTPPDLPSKGLHAQVINPVARRFIAQHIMTAPLTIGDDDGWV